MLQGRGPGIGHGAGRGTEALRQAVELHLHRLADALVRAPGLVRDRRHRGLDDRLEALAGHAGAGAQAVVQRLFHGPGEARVGHGHVPVELLLPVQQLLVQLLVATLHLLHQGLQLVRHIGQCVGLQLQRPEGLLPLMNERERAEHGGDLRVQLPRHPNALAAADGRHQAQHGRCRHPGHRGAECQGQPLDGLRQDRADGLEIRRALEREHGALEGDDHAEEGAEHAQHHQQADQVRRERQPGQGDALALDAQAHGVLQRRMHAAEPVVQVLQWLRHVGQRSGQRGRGHAETPDFERAEHVHPADGHGHAQGDSARTDKTRAHPDDARQAEGKGDRQDCSARCIAVHWCCFASILSASIIPATGCKRSSSSASRASRNSRTKVSSHAPGAGTACASPGR